jgi:hypothetical protein
MELEEILPEHQESRPDRGLLFMLQPESFTADGTVIQDPDPTQTTLSPEPP